jgi:hypothetical protein
MSWHFLQGQEEASWAESSLDGAPSALLRLINTPGESCSPDSGTDACQGSQSGITSQPLTEIRGAERSMSSLAGSLAKTSAPPEKAPELTEPGAECGATWHASLAKFDPVSRSWKTPQCSLLAGLDEFSGTWPRWGMMRAGECWELTTLEPRIGESESGLWPTLRAQDREGLKAGRKRDSPGLGVVVRTPSMWPTPTVCGNHNCKGASATSGDGLATAVKMWPTPDTCAGGTGPSQLNRDSPRLATIVKHPRLWNTPKARDWKDGTSKGKAGWTGDLGKQVLWATPQASDNRDRGNLGMPLIQRRQKIGKQISLGQSVSATSGALNPPWVEWLMGWPIGWTDLKPLETDKFQAWLRSHGIYSDQTEESNQ